MTLSNSLNVADVVSYGRKLAVKGEGLVLDAVAMTCLAIHLEGNSKSSRSALKGASFANQASVMGDNLMTLKKLDIPTIVANANVTPDDTAYIAKLCSAIVKSVKGCMATLETTSNIAFYNKLAKLVKAMAAKVAEDTALAADKAAKALVWEGNKTAAIAAGMTEDEAANHANEMAAATLKAEYDLAEAKAAIEAANVAKALATKEAEEKAAMPVIAPVLDIPAQIAELILRASNEELTLIATMIEAEVLSRNDMAQAA